MVQGSRDQNEIVVADLDLEDITAARDVWAFYRDRRPETYDSLSEL